MASDDDGPNFSYAYGNAAWNPAMRPNSGEIQQAVMSSAPPSKPTDVPVHQDLLEHHESMPPTASDLHPHDVPLASRHNLEPAEPTSDDDFFDRHGSDADPPNVHNAGIHQEAVDVDGMANQISVPADAVHVVGAGHLVDGQEPPAQTETPELHAHEIHQRDDQAAVNHKPNEAYEFQAETTMLEEAIQESSNAPLVSDPEPTSIDWGNDDETFDFGGSQDNVMPPMAATAPALETLDTHAVQEMQQVKEIPISTVSQREADIDWGVSDHHDFDIRAPPATAPVVADAVKETPVVNAPQSEDISALWQAAFEDDELLPDSGNDGWGAFEDGEGFLDNTTQQTTAVSSAPIEEPPRAVSSSVIPEAKANKYAPVEAQQPPAPPSNPYLPNQPQFTDFSQLDRPSSSSRVIAPSPYQMAYAQQAPQRPPMPSSAESFADKSKGGYHSPYDLPDDLTKQPRRRPIHHTPSMPALQSMQPPPRSSSMTSNAQIAPPRTRPPSSGASQNLTPPSSSHSSQNPNELTASKTTSPTNRTERKGSNEFFADLPDVRRPRHQTPSGRYTPMSPAAQTPPLNQAPPMATRPIAPPAPTLRSQASAPSLATQLRPPERMPLYGDEPQSTARSSTVPVPPPSTRYSPALQTGAPAVKSRYSPVPAAALPTAPPAGSRYSPAPPAGSSHHGYTPQSNVPPRPPLQTYAPRTSSPLTYSTVPQQQQQVVTEAVEPSVPPQESPVYQRSSFDRSSSLTGHLPLEPVSEDGPFVPTPPQAEPSILGHTTVSPRSATPPLPGQRSGPSSAVSSPQKRNQYTPQHASLASSSDPGFAPPPRSHTSSPGKTIQPQMRMMSMDRPASAHGQLPMARDFTAPAVILAPRGRSGTIHEANLIPPQNETANDPLERWKGSPIFNWGNGGVVVTCFPQHTPRYGSGFIGPAIQPTPGEVKIRSGKDLVPHSELFSKFPGPLKKGKKKEVLAWLKTAIEELERHMQAFSLQSGLPGVDVRMEERILLWKTVALMVEHDGVLEGKAAIEEAVKALFSMAPPIDNPTNASGPKQVPTVLPDAFDPNALGTLRTYLYRGEREKAVWHAVDQRLWAHALLIASTLPRDIWKQVVQEFVRKEISKAGDINQPVAALYQVFAGNWEESIDELVSVSARAGFQMVSKNGGGVHKDALAGLNKWRDTLLLVLNNRSPNDFNALLALGRLLRGYGRIEAAHICFLFARSVAYFGGSEDPQADFTLLGGNPFTEGSDLGQDLDSVLLSEVYEFALTLSPTPMAVPHLQAYKLYHAEVLAESGHRTEAQQYCDSIAAIIHSKTKPSPHFNVFLMQRLDDLSKRLSQAPMDGSSWKPSMDKVSSSLWGKFNSFVTGEDNNDAASNHSGQGADTGNFIRMKGDTPDLSRQASGTDLYSTMMSNGGVAPAAPVNSRYAPVSANSSRTSLEQPSQSRYAPTTSQGGYQPRTSLESTRSAYEPSPAPSSSLGLGLPISPQRSASFNTISHKNSYTPPSFQLPVTSSAPPVVEPTISYSPSPYQPTPPEETLDIPPTQPAPSFNGYQPVVADEVTSSYQPASFDSYQPPTRSYEPTVSDEAATQSSYEPPTSYQPYEPPAEETEPSSPEDAPKPPKKKSYMDDDNEDDDLLARAEALKKSKRTEADRAADEAFRKAAEADAARGPSAAEKKGWFGGWWGKKDPHAPQTGPVKANLGEENSFVFDKELGKWINKKAGASGQASTPVAAATPPPPRMAPRPASGSGLGVGTANGGLGVPPTSVPSSLAGPPPVAGMRAASVPPPMMTRQDSQASSTGSGPPPLAHAGSSGPPSAIGAVGGPSSGPPSRPATSMSNASDLDDLLGAPAGRKVGKKGGQRKGRYVDVMANQK